MIICMVWEVKRATALEKLIALRDLQRTYETKVLNYSLGININRDLKSKIWASKMDSARKGKRDKEFRK